MIDLESIMADTENCAVEAKLASGGLPRSLWETYSSFANTFGGVILLGVEEDSNHNLVPRGVEDPQKLISDIWNVLNNPNKISANILLENHVYTLSHENKRIVVMEVPRAERCDKPIYINNDMFKGTFRRNHEGDYHCTPEEIKSMLRDQSDTSQDALLLEDLSISDLNQESICRYRILFHNLKPTHVWGRLSDDEFLIKIGAARKSRVDGKIHPTLGGLIFFGDFITITNELPYYFLDFREHLSKTARWSDRVCSGDGYWSGNIFDFYFKVVDRLTSDVKRPFELNSQLQRIDDTPIHKSVRECLANALIHADYYGRRGIVIDKEFQRITISNPGTFRIGIDEAIAGGISDARNTHIFNMFSLINVGERSGTGLCDVYHVFKENDFQSPTLFESVNPDRVTLILNLEFRHNPEVVDGNSGVNDGNPDGNDGNNGGNNGGNPSDNDDNRKDIGLTHFETYVYNLIGQDPKLSTSKLSLQTGKSQSTVERAIRTLKEKGKIRREGSTHGRWIIL